MRAYDIIKRKRDGGELSFDEIGTMINGFVYGSIPDYQAAAFLMAVYFRGMTEEETCALTEAMCKSGDEIDLAGIEGFTIDKHSTGGVGDKTSLVLGPILASLGLKVAKMSGRGLGHTGGTLDKLESIEGFSCELSALRFVEIVNKVGIAIVGQTGNLVPADKKLYALRDVTATIDSIPLIAASIMSKKLAVANKGLVLDVKVGSGAFMRNLNDAEKLAGLMVEIGKKAGRKVTAVLSNMDEPLGEMIGNALEVKEAIATLHAKGPRDFTELVKTLACQALIQAGIAGKGGVSAADMVEETVSSGKAWNTFLEMVRMQGGNVEMLKNPDLLPRADSVIPVKSTEEGFVSSIDCEGVGIAAMMLGAGRETKESKIDMGVGVKLLKHVGARIKRHETIAEIHANRARDFRPAEERLRNCFVIAAGEVVPNPLIHKIIT